MLSTSKAKITLLLRCRNLVVHFQTDRPNRLGLIRRMLGNFVRRADIGTPFTRGCKRKSRTSLKNLLLNGTHTYCIFCKRRRMCFSIGPRLFVNFVGWVGAAAFPATAMNSAPFVIHRAACGPVLATRWGPSIPSKADISKCSALNSGGILNGKLFHGKDRIGSAVIQIGALQRCSGHTPPLPPPFELSTASSETCTRGGIIVTYH